MTAMVTLYRNNHCEVMISLFGKVMGLQKRSLKNVIFCHHKVHEFRRRKVIQHDRSGHMVLVIPLIFINNGSR